MGMGGMANPAMAAMGMGAGFNPAAMGMGCGAAGMMMMGQQPNKPFSVSGMMPVAGMPNMTVPVNSKKQRELYIGNLPAGLSEPMLKELFAQLLNDCDGFDPSMGPAVLNVQMCGGGTYAFVEYRDEQCCETAMSFSGMVLSGKALKINHPNGYVPPPVPVTRLTPKTETLQRFGLAVAANEALPPMTLLGAASSAVRPETKKARELYIGNLTVGMVSSAMLKELFAQPLLTLPGAEDGSGVPPVIDARVDAGGKFAFVEFRSEELASTALALFNNMELCGRPMQVARPTGYVPGPNGPPPPLAGAGLPPPASVPIPAATLPTLGGLIAPPVGGLPETTRRLRLENLGLDVASLADDAEYAECVEDIRGECERFGTIESFAIPRVGELHGHGEDDAGKAFVTYAETSSAAKAYAQLHGRDFDGNKVRATFLPV